MIRPVLACLLGYLLGSASFGILVPRFLGTAADIRALGSGNAGATNVLRTQGKIQGGLVLLGDLLKGFLAVHLGLALAGIDGGVLAAAGAMAGHCYPLFFGLKGGKGVATGAGVVLALLPQAMPVMLVVFVVTVAATRFVSLGSLLGALALLPCALLFQSDPRVVIFAVFVIALIFYRHRGNLRRLAAGQENRLGEKKGAG
ncbi:MAG: glycerol-3-phosphate 1-O-acyltransferase PlsY [Peptococcaceae bacterium]|jgi:glycerol-3-phosphate acyltransferase PlsY|nr:glycerol-3-phosphate 1-O-acyltransferase PlsY [Peptococcaceae bacterium]